MNTEELTIDLAAAAACGLAEIIGERRSAWSLSELAEVLNCSTDTLYDQASRGIVPHYKLGSKYYFDPKATSEWLKNKMVTL